MAYTKTNWVNDQQPDIDADNLNKMEQGIADAQFPDGGTEGQLLARTANGQGWVDPPNSAVWGGITGDIEDQTDLQAALSSVGKVDSVNGIEPDAQKNVQVDVEITKQGWDALPSTKYTDDINYYIKDGTNIPQASVISASGVQYDNTQSGLTADTVQEAVDENASAISSLSAGLMTFTTPTIVGGRVRDVYGGYAYMSNHVVFVQIRATMNLSSGGEQFSIFTGIPIPRYDSALAAWIDGVPANCRVGTDSSILLTTSVTADKTYNKAICITGVYYVN